MAKYCRTERISYCLLTPDKEGGEAVDVALPLIRGAALLVVQVHDGRIFYVEWRRR